MAIDPNIALGVKPLELTNPLAQYGMVSQIQHAQNQNRLADMQMQEYQRTRLEEDAARNFLRGRDLTAPETVSGLAQFGKTGLAYGKELSGQRKTNIETEAAQFKLANDKLKHGWQSMGEASTPQAAIEKLNDGVKNGYFDMKTATAEIAKLENMPLDQYKQYRVEKIMGLLDAKDQLAAVSPKIARQEAGGQILNIQDNPLLPGYGLPVQGMKPIVKTATIGERTARDRLEWEKANPGYEVKEVEDGTMYGVNKRTLQAVPITIGAAAPAGGAPVAGVSTGAVPAGTAVPLKGKGTALTESQGNATAFGMRMIEANKLLSDLEKGGTTSGGRIKGAVEGTLTSLIPYQGERLAAGLGSVMNAAPAFLGGPNENQQSYAQAKENFITAVLRKESGASISPDEFAREERKYFPQAGEGEKIIKQKQRARELAIDAMKIQAGPGAKNIGNPNDPLGLGIGGR